MLAVGSTVAVMRRALRWIAIVVLLLIAGAGALIAIGPPKVPADAIARAVTREQALLDRAWALPAARMYQRELYWQKNGSFCGPASLLNVFASQGKRFPDEAAILDGSGKCWSGACILGLTLDELGAIAHLRTQAKVSVLRDLSRAKFEEHLKRSNDPARRYTVNFTRKTIFGAGGGHHSPLAGYLEREHLALVLDVNRDFKPWLVESDRLFAAIDGVDSASGKKRGLLLIE
jgi:hypothetical protein